MLLTKLENFSGMHENGCYFLQSMRAKKIDFGKSILTPSYFNYFRLSEDTTGFANLGAVDAFTTLKHLSTEYTTVVALSSGYMFGFSILSAAQDKGEMRTIPTSAGNYAPSSYPDLITTKNENILYSNAYYLGIAYRGICKTGSNATTIIDTAGRNFDTLGIGTAAPINAVFNLATKKKNTITTIGNGDATNDKLTLTADIDTYTAGNYFLAFADKGAKNGGNFWNFFASTAYPQFVGQETAENFRRQIVLFDTEYLIGNGNWLAALSTDEATWDDNYKQLPDKTQFMSMSVNQDRILVGCEYRGKGRILLWNGWADGWLSTIEVDQPVTAVVAYGGGWIVCIGAKFYLTDGYTLEFLTDYPDLFEFNSTLNLQFNQIKIIDNKLVIAAGGDGYMRNKNGIAVYDFKTGWTFVPYYDDSAYQMLSSVTPGAIFNAVESSLNYIFTSFGGGGGTHNNCIAKLYTNTVKDYGAMFFIPFNKKVQVKEIKLNLAPKFDEFRADSGVTMDITVSVGDCKRPLWRYSQSSSGGMATLITVAGADITPSFSGEVGDEVLVLDKLRAGERSFVTSIANKGEANEQLTISPALSGALANGDTFNLISVKKCLTRTVNPINVPDELNFPVQGGFYGDQMYLEVFFKNPNTYKGLDIISIEIYGE
jgi:hypothetical protein